MTAATGITITNGWKPFRYGVKRHHYEKLIGIRELSERLAQDFLNNNFSPDRGNPKKNIPLLDEVDDGDTVYTCRALKFYSCISPSAAVSTISDMNLNSASTISIGFENITQDWPEGSYLVLRSKHMVPRGRPLVAIVCKYNARKVISFIVTDNTVITNTGITYLSKYPYKFTNVVIRPVARPLVMSKKSDVNEVEYRNKSR